MPCGTEKKWGEKKLNCVLKQSTTFFGVSLIQYSSLSSFRTTFSPPVSRLERLEEHSHAKVVKVFQRETAMGPARLLCKFCRGEKEKNVYTERILRRVHGWNISKRI